MKKLSLLPALTFALLQAGGAGAVETPTGIYFDEISSFSITASAYAPTPGFTGLETGLSGVNVAKNGVYSAWRNGNVWTAKAAMPTARTYVSAARIGGKIYVVGGNNNNGTNLLDANEEYDPVANTWSVKAAMPTKRTNFAVAVANDRLYAIGGSAVSSIVSINESYDPASNAWAAKAAMGTARVALSAGALNGKIYAIGGWTGTSLTLNEEYDPLNDTWVTKAPMPTSRASFSISVLGGKLYAMGGHGVNTSTLPASVEAFDPVANTWTAKASIITPRPYLVSAPIGGKIFAIAGWNSSVVNINEEFDPLANTWTSRASLPTTRCASAASVSGGKLFVFGGWTGNGSADHTTNEMYDPGTAFVFSGLTPNTLYTFKAKARDAAGVETAEGPSISTYTLAAQPSAATGFSAPGLNSLAFSWAANGNPGGTLYRAQVSSNVNFTTVVSSETYSNTTTISGLAAGTTYYARVAAVSGSGVLTEYLLLGSTVTSGSPASIVTPTAIYFDDISSHSITASAYAPTPAFTGLETGLSGVNLARDGSYAGWRNGNLWASKASMSSARNSMVAGTINGKIYVVGGYNGSSYLASNEEYDPVSNSWTPKAALPTARYHAAGGVVSEKLYVIGGSNGTLLSSNEAYDPVSNTWSVKAAMPSPRDQLCAAVVNGKIYAIGGMANGSAVSTNEEYDPELNAWATKSGMPSPRYQLGAGVAGGKIYVLGGISGASILNQNYEYSPASDSWTAKTAMPTARYAMAVGAVGGKVYALGGYNSLSGGGTNYDINEEYDPASNAWTARASMPTSRREVSVAANKGRLYLIGGYNGNTVSTNEEYDPGVAFHFSGLMPNTQYVFKSKARDAAGVETAESVLFSTYTLAALPAPGVPVFSGKTSSAMTISWTANGNPAGTRYRAQLSAYQSFSAVATSETYSTSASFSGLVSGTTYYARVAAINENSVPTPYLPLGSDGTTGGTANVAPALDWTGEVGYSTDGLSPEIGSSSTSFVFMVKYTDANNDAPGGGYPRLRVFKGGMEIPGSPFSMTFVSGSYAGGATYVYSRTLSANGSDYSYYFEAQDANGSNAGGPATAVIDAPDVGGLLSPGSQGGYQTTIGDNLFRPRSGASARIRYHVESAGQVSLKIYDINGNMLRVLYEGPASAGDGQVNWDGRDDSGLYVVPGIYFMHYLHPGGGEVRKLGVKK